MTDNKDDKTRIVTTGNTGKNNGKDSNKGEHKQDVTPPQSSNSTGDNADQSTVFVGQRTTPPSHGDSESTVITSRTPTGRNSDDLSIRDSSGAIHTPTLSAMDNQVIKGRFELVSLLGAGGMGAVYKALDRRKVEASDSDPYVAVKLLNDEFRQHPDAFISLQRESRKSQTLAHPNIVTVYDFDRDQNTVFMTMEFLEGAPLDELLREFPNGLEPEDAKSNLEDISNALIYAHSHNIIHSDFKPGNIFITKNKGAKVFDFGIARAVSAGSAAHTAGEKTIFDAGTLGALTPAYASNEMLCGAEPSESDDVYALGCVAYELYSGKHPFKKTPANQALEKNLKPKKLKGLSRRQWNALSNALELSRDNRTATVAEFYESFFGKPKVLLWALVASVIAFGVAGALYLEQSGDQARAQEELKVQLQEELEQQLEQSTIGNQRQTIERLVQISALTPKWDKEVQKELRVYAQLVPDDTETEVDVRSRVSIAYLDEAKRLMANDALDEVIPRLKASSRWGGPENDIRVMTKQVITLQEAERLREENLRLAEAKEEADRLEEERIERQTELEVTRRTQIRDEVAGLENALRCPNEIDVEGKVAGHLRVLDSLEPERAATLHKVVADSLTQCFDKLSAISPYSAEKMLNESLTLLPEQAVLKSLKVDYCSHLEPGSGSRGRRYTCADPLPRQAKGPTMVVVPSPSGGAIAISQYEITYDDVSDYCTVSQLCDSSKYATNFLPVHSIDVNFAENYAGWLSSVTGHTYRLPNYDEWLIAANADGRQALSDRNCYLKYGGIEKGLELLKTTNGSQNSYGLASYIGNVQEWVYDNHELFVAGGSRQTPMTECRTSTIAPHMGTADEFTGFRLVRELLN